MSPPALWKMLIEVYHDWSDDKASRLAAALAFYTILSLAPVLIIVIDIAGFAFGEPAVREEIAYAMQSLVGQDGASAIKMVMEHAALPGHSTLAEILGLIILLFALIYKVVPDARVAWSDVWIGAAFTTLLFIIGKFLMGLYLSYSAEGAAYGAAGSIVILMLWIYYSAQIFLMGAEFTKVYAEKFGSRIKMSR
jgi:uncharacterized BrkB/YihY/UPF0761 family membrane protein